MKILLFVLLAVCSITAVFAQAGPNDVKNGQIPLSDDILKKVAGVSKFDYYGKSVSVASKMYGEYWVFQDWANEGGWGTFDIRGWDGFTFLIGFDDNRQGDTGIVTILVDGEQLLVKNLRGGVAPSSVMIPLTGKQTMTIRSSNGAIRYIEPYLIKGNPNRFACVTCGEKFMSQDMLDAHLIAKHGSVCQYCNARFLSRIDLDNHIKNAHQPVNNTAATPAPTAATFVVDPNDLDKLAEALRKQVDAKPDVKENVKTAQIGVMTFNLIDISSASVASNVAEDLTTSLMKSDFQTVERGQLDKVLKELKIQDSALIDPATALKIGNQTGCNVLIVGSISDRAAFIVINARLLDTKTGRTIAAERVECRKIDIKR